MNWSAEESSIKTNSETEAKPKSHRSCYHPFQSGFDTGLGKNFLTDRTAENSSIEISTEKRAREIMPDRKAFTNNNSKPDGGGRGNNRRGQCGPAEFRTINEAMGHPTFSSGRKEVLKRQYPGPNNRMDRAQMNPAWFYPDVLVPFGSDPSGGPQTFWCNRISAQNCGASNYHFDRRSERLSFPGGLDASLAAASPFPTCSFVGSTNFKGPGNSNNLTTPGRNLCLNAPKTGGHNRPMMCNFCKNNKEVPDIYMNHYLYDPKTKKLTCPVLRKHVCEICGETGDKAHTLQYCPINRQRGLQAKVPVLLKTRTITNSTGKIRRN